jgi:succinate-semialdehyde dehydrogenase/glutarate-semialdehyde dehydrogenase
MSCVSVDLHDGKVLKTFEDLTDRQLEASLSTAAGCCGTWGAMAYAERAAVLDRATVLMMERLDLLALTVSREMGRTMSQSLGEVALCAGIIRYYASSGDDFLPRRRPGPAAPDSDRGEPVPGILFGVEPWNFPYYQLTRFAAPNLMAGNVVMVKHTERGPQCAEDFARLWLDAGAPAGAFTNLFLSPDQVTRVIEDSRVKGVALVGAVHAGRRVASRVARPCVATSKAARDGAAAGNQEVGRDVDRTIRSAVWGEAPGYFGPQIS